MKQKETKQHRDTKRALSDGTAIPRKSIRKKFYKARITQMEAECK